MHATRTPLALLIVSIFLASTLLSSALLSTVHAGPIPESAEDATKILGNGDINTRNRIQIVFAGDGWMSDQQDEYKDHCEKIAEGLFEHSPYKEYKNFFVISRADVTSNATCSKSQLEFEKNPSVAALPTTPYGVWLKALELDPTDTAAGFPEAHTFQNHRDASLNGKTFIDGMHPAAAKMNDFLGATKKTLGEGTHKDLVVVIANNPQISNGVAAFPGPQPLWSMIGYETDFGPENDPLVVIGWLQKQGWGIAEVLAHEVGHGVFDLKDEYGGNDPTPALIAELADPVNEPTSPNVTFQSDPAKAKWIKWKDKFSGYGHHPGGMTLNAHVYHGEDTCKMNDHWGKKYDPGSGNFVPNHPGGVKNTYPFRPICHEAAIQHIYDRVSPIDNMEPEAGNLEVDARGVFSGIGGEQRVRVEVLGGEDLEIECEFEFDGNKLDDEFITKTESDTGATYEIDLGREQLPPGNRELKCRCQDRTPILENIPEDEDPVATFPPFTKTWSMNITDPGFGVRLVRAIIGWGD